VAQNKLIWQSKFVLLVVLPYAAASVILQAHWWAVNAPPVAIWTAGVSLLLALVVYRLGAATPGAAFAGAVVTASLMFSTAMFPYKPWQTALSPVVTVFALTYLATWCGRGQKELLGTAERKRGRNAAQIAANLGVAALTADGLAQALLTDSHWFTRATQAPMPLFAVGLAALAEATADTVSSEIGQVLGGQPRMVTTLQVVEPGADGAISWAGTLAGTAAAGIVAAVGTLAVHGDSVVFWIGCAGGVFGLFLDSLLGATLERRGWLNNDAVNFLSTASAAGFALGAMAAMTLLGLR
jgi:uncharacterized protein (TIGR00297 family)